MLHVLEVDEAEFLEELKACVSGYHHHPPAFVSQLLDSVNQTIQHLFTKALLSELYEGGDVKDFNECRLPFGCLMNSVDKTSGGDKRLVCKLTDSLQSGLMVGILINPSWSLRLNN